MQSDAPRRIQRKRTKGWKMPEGAVYVGRGSAWGNPFRIGPDGDAATVVDMYRQDIESRLSYGSGPDLAAAVAELRGKTLMCWCKEGSPCHGGVLLRLANAPAAQEGEKAPAASRATGTRGRFKRLNLRSAAGPLPPLPASGQVSLPERRDPGMPAAASALWRTPSPLRT